VLDPGIPVPAQGRTFSARRRVGLADLDAHGRVRLDAVVRFLQDVAIEDVRETGWGTPAHLWFVRSIRLDAVIPPLDDRELELVTWCSSLAAIAAGRRWSVIGDRGGRIEVDSVWIHLGPDQRPARIEGFGTYGEATGGRKASTKLDLPDPPAHAIRTPWPLRVSDVDPHGHVNNAVHWQAVEHVLASAALDPRRPLVAELDYHDPLDLGDPLELTVAAEAGSVLVGFHVGAAVRAVARVRAGA
jgi:acyl-ACP thioesterase